MSFKYIGIRGHRGAGKQTVAYLLGVAIDYYSSHKSFEGFDDVYKDAVDRVHQDENFLPESNLKRVQFVGFADTPKLMLAQLIGVPTEWMWDDWKKDSVFVNMQDFSLHQCKDKLEMYHMKNRSFTAPALADRMKEHDDFNHKTWISLRELIIYFGKYTMQSMFGKNIWIKAEKASQEDLNKFYAGNKTVYRIFTDCKFKSEISYIYDNLGYVINVSRPECVKDNSEISNELEDDNRYDYHIKLESDNLMAIQKQIQEIVINQS